MQIDQSQSDRSKKKFLPVRIDFKDDKPVKVTERRLHFSKTTHNIRKKERHHSSQKYFQLVVALEAVVTGASSPEPVCLLASESVIVRVANLAESEQAWETG